MATFAITRQMIKQPFRILRGGGEQQFADPHIFEPKHGVLFHTIWTMVALVSSGTSWETELEQLTVQMQMLSHHLIIAPIIKFEKYHNSRSVLRTQSMTYTGHFIFPVLSSPSLAEVREAARKSPLSPDKSSAFLV